MNSGIRRNQIIIEIMIRIIIESLLEIIIKIVIEISPGRAMGPLGQDNGAAGTGQWDRQAGTMGGCY